MQLLYMLTDYSFQHFSKNLCYFVLKSIPIIPILFFRFIISNAWSHPRKQGAFVVGTVYSIYDTSKVVNESHPYLFKLTHLT